MEDLYESAHENVQLAVRRDLEVVYVERPAGRDTVRVLTRVGGRFALHAAGVGLVLLAHAPEEVQARALAGGLRRWTPHTVTDAAVLRRAQAEMRRSVVAHVDSLRTPIALRPAVRAAGRSTARSRGGGSRTSGWAIGDFSCWSLLTNN